MKFWRYGTKLGNIEANFLCACTEADIKELPVKSMTQSFTVANSISYNKGITPSYLAISLVCVCRNSVNSASVLQSAITNVFSYHDILCKGNKTLIIWWLSDIFSLRMCRNGYLGASSQKSWPCHSLQQPIRRVNFHYLMTFTAYIPRFFVLNFHVTLTFDLDDASY